MRRPNCRANIVAVAVSLPPLVSPLLAKAPMAEVDEEIDVRTQDQARIEPLRSMFDKWAAAAPTQYDVVVVDSAHFAVWQTHQM